MLVTASENAIQNVPALYAVMLRRLRSNINIPDGSFVDGKEEVVA